MSDAALPGPPGRWGGLNHLQAIRADFRAFGHALHQQHGDLVTYRVLGRSIYQVASPQLAHEVLVAKAKFFHKPDNQKRAFARIIGNNLFTSDGDEWLARRRLLAPLFQPQIIDRYRTIVVRQAEAVLGRLSGGQVNVSRAAGEIALLSVAEALFGATINDRADQFLDIATRLQVAVSRQIVSPFLLPMWLPTSDNRVIREAIEFFHGLIGSLIEERRRSPQKYADLLSALLTATDAADGARLTDRQAIDEALTMLLAGSDTTAAGISWAAFLLASHADRQRELQQAVAEVTQGGHLLAEHAPALSLAEHVFDEAMRIYPPAVAIARQAAAPVEIGGAKIARGGLCFVMVYSIHHDPRWFPRPEEFRPQRFAADCNEVPENAFLPFGLGPRACIGRRFATMEGTLVLAELVRRFELHLLEPGQQPEMETQLSLHPRGGLHLRLESRLPSYVNDRK